MLLEEDLKIVRQVRDAYSSLIRVPCTGCRYCMPCPQNVNIPGMFELMNEGSMFGNWDLQRRRYGHMKDEENAAGNCLHCGLCEKKCPQHIAIRDELARADRELT
jgi:predicted aldo/keto reductase-like oxidoreductase